MIAARNNRPCFHRRQFALRRTCLFFGILCVTFVARGESTLVQNARDADFVLSAETGAATLCIETNTDSAVARAAGDLASDIEHVSGHKPVVARDPKALSGDVVLVGVLGQSALLDELVTSGKLELKQLAGAWESFVIAVVPHPFPNVRQALVIAGSDRRGAIYGLYEISAQIGVSPWQWWADVPPPKKSTLTIPAATRRFGPPSVKYRGIFINDEDWGLQPWAAKTFEPASGGIGPKTYAKVFELLLRLRANTLWPGMHPTTKPFNAFPENKQIADDYAIVMGSSHAEPMLRNNVGEWPHDRAADYNYITNREGVLRYWEQRVAENGRFENIYTLGMRGIHDSDMQGPKTDAERIRTLEQIFADQRTLIEKYSTRRVPPDGQAEVGRVIPNAPSAETTAADKARRIRDNPPYLHTLTDVPQMFCAYKEVLALYRQGLRVPDDVTIVWPDDNFGYVRNFASAAERTRSGGFGVYYHLSYLGRPLSYLWLCTTPPALVWEEMHKAYEHGADRIWIANVGDIKPAEIPTEFFLQMAWDIDRWRPENLNNFLPEWAAREFGSAHAAEIASLLADYYVLNFQRKPEHLQWWLPREPRVPSPLTDAEVQTRLDAFAQLRARADALRAKIPAAQQDAFYELVYYPIVGSSLANERTFEGERGHLDLAHAADARLITETRFFNEELARGKWRGIMSLEPADDQWFSMRPSRWTPPAAARPLVSSPAPGTFISLDAARFTANTPRGNVAWQIISGLGHTGAAVTVLPTTFSPLDLADATKSAPRLDYALTVSAAGKFPLRIHLLPTHPIDGQVLRLAYALDDRPPELVEYHVIDGDANWARGVLDEVYFATATLDVTAAGSHTLRVYGLDPGVVVDRIVIDLSHPR